MFALIAAVLFLVGIFQLDGPLTSNYYFWTSLGLIALAVHLAWTIALPRFQNRA